MEPSNDNAGVSRGQNQLHIVPEEFGAGAAIVLPLLERIDPDAGTTQALVLTSDDEAAASLAERIASRVDERVRIVAATEGRRSARVLRGGPAHVVVATPGVLAGLLSGATLKLEAVRIVVLAWLDDVTLSGSGLESVMAEVPKDAARIILAGEATPAVEQLVERYARRARKIQSAASDQPPVSLSYIVTTAGGRLAALRRLLDAVDPESAVILTRDEESRAAVAAGVRALGYGADTSIVRVVAAGNEVSGAALGVLYDLPSSEGELRRGVAALAPGRVLALVAPRQIATLRRLAGGSVAPFSLPDAAARARAREEMVRDELREVLEGGQFARELLTLEPLLADHDGAEIAAAALKLLEQRRAAPTTPAALAQQGPVTRLYFNVGSTDDMRAGDLVGAILGEAGLSKSDIGRVDVRDRHSTVEVATPLANVVVDKLTGIQMKGRRVIARIDEDRPRESRGERGERGSRGDRGSSRGRPERGERRGPGGPGGRDRRPARERPPRGR